jgi:hypothetical protein
MRPPPVKNAWAWIVIAVSLVMFMAITVWLGAGGGDRGEPQITDNETMHRLAQRARSKWPQVPGPPEVYREQARAAMAKGDWSRAQQRTSMALALSPDDLDDWVVLVRLSAQAGLGQEVLSPEESTLVLLEATAIQPDHVGLPLALGWLSLRKGDATAALRSAGEHPRGLGARLLRLKALGESATVSDGESVLEVAAAHGPVCRWTADRALSVGLGSRAHRILQDCVKSGADAETRQMLTEVVMQREPMSAEITPETLDSTPSSP